MSFDFDISVRIKDKRTGDIISGPKVIPAPASDYVGYEEVCWWNSSIFMDAVLLVLLFGFIIA